MKVTLLGDSIRMIGYGPLVPALLGDGFEVYQPDDNCRFAKYTLRGLFDWEKEMAGSQIVHWNNGLWDFCDLFGDGPFSTVEEYTTTMLRIADILLARCAKVIFATTTPVTEQNKHDKNPVIAHYNRLIVPLLEEKGVIINDLHRLVVKDINRYIRQDDNIHLTDEGAAVCARQVADTILSVSKTISTPDDGTYSPRSIQSGAPV